MTAPGELRAGSRLPQLVIDPVEPGPMKVVALLQDDPNPIHWDPAAAARAGLGQRVVNQGAITASWLLEMAIRAAGDPDRVRALRVRFLGSVCAGDRVECGGLVAFLEPAAGVAELELLTAVEGATVAAAGARIELPR